MTRKDAYEISLQYKDRLVDAIIAADRNARLECAEIVNKNKVRSDYETLYDIGFNEACFIINSFILTTLGDSK